MTVIVCAAIAGLLIVEGANVADWWERRRQDKAANPERARADQEEGSLSYQEMEDERDRLARELFEAETRLDFLRTICGYVCSCGPNGEPLACGYPPAHEGPHSWSTLPTFSRADQEEY